MGSSRASTPASGRGSPEPLTPRSKIKALLAAVDNSDDEGSGPQLSKVLQQPFSRPNNLNSTQETEATDDEGSDEEIRPRGRLAARMHAAAVSAEEHTTEELQSKSVTGARDHAESTTQEDIDMTQPLINDDEEEDDDILPVAPRRVFRRAPQDGESDAEEAPATRSPSPGLFVSSPARPSPTKNQGLVSDNEDILPVLKSDRFKALVERKKQERLAREAAEEERNAERRAMQEKLASELEQLDSDHSNVSDITDDEGGRKLTQGARPTRKASKKAVEDMNRETQRMARNMQLAHEAKTRKKISKSSLFERFNFRPAGAPESKTASSSRPTTPPTDVEMKTTDTPPSSPPMAEKQQNMPQTTTAAHDTSSVLEKELSAQEKGKGKEVVQTKVEQPIANPKRNVRVKMPPQAVNLITFDSDDELEITNLKRGKVDAVFNNVPKQTSVASHSMQALRALAQLKSPGKDSRRKKNTTDISVGELQYNLHQRARQQAKIEREKRMQMLKAQGIVVQTAEERERQMQEVEDIVAKAREEAEQIMAQERAEAKKNKGENDDPLDWDESDDEEYEASADDGEPDDIELSGSEDENNESEQDENMEPESAGLVDGQAAEDGESEDDETIEQSDDGMEDAPMADDDDDGLPMSNARRSRKQVMILSDDEETDPEATPRPKTTSQATPKPKSTSQATPSAKGSTTPGSVLRSARKNFIPGLPVKGPAGLGLTQIFAGTMDDSQMSPTNGPTQSMMPDFDNFPDSNFSATMDEPVNMMTQTQKPETQNIETQGVQLNFSQSQMRGLDSLLREVPPTQISDMMEPSQDGGFQEHTPLKDRFIDAPHSTVETVVAHPEDVVNGSPLIRRGRLRRKMESVAEVEELPPTAVEMEVTTSNAFGAMLEGAKEARKQKLAEEFNRKKSKAKEMVEEQAEESEDEYRGLGGADGEDSDDESVASVKEMIDDAAGNDMDEGKLAAYYADQARASDEKQVEKLFKDITSGMLRRKRGADYDLSDSDDGGEARRKMKRRQFAKMQKALFTDERVKKMAENPGNQAFLRTIEDHGSDEEMDFLDITEETTKEAAESQSQEDQNDKLEVVPDSQPRSVLGSASSNRAPAHMRRVKAGRKPSNIGEVRETLSNLLEDGREMSIIPATEAGSDSEDEEPTPTARSDKENHAPNPRRRAAVVDRISLKRNSSSMLSDSNSRLAFAAQSSSSSFKVPALLRRATTNSLQSTSTSSSGTSTPLGSTSASGFGNEAKIKKTASKKSGINAFARENERRAKIQENERRRQEKKVRGAENRLGVVGGLLGKNAFQ